MIGSCLLERRVVLHNPSFHQHQEISRPIHYLGGLRLRRDMGAVIIHRIALAPAGVKISGEWRTARPSANSATSKVVLWWPTPEVRYPAQATAIVAACNAAL